ncbi:ATP-dependent DNA helicase [Teredinibacter turnerae]|uniref:ATP-dependent DNA helicase n=1 Tax=Teredinibacter turnerae TaxID=2426 RepID=UPI000368D91A|nr:ATP-dependent DNA helicase [Teredinibacter turnerae]
MCSGNKPPPSVTAHAHYPDLNLSVTELVSFAARKGDLFNDDAGGPDAQQGQRGHQQIQKSRKAPWEAEIALKDVWLVENQRVTLGGRVDLINRSTNTVVIEEIKTCLIPGHLIPETRKLLHWAQLRVYAALYVHMTPEHPENAPLLLRLTYFDLTTQQIFQQDDDILPQEAVEYCESLLTVYLRWWQQVYDRRTAARVFARDLTFPFAHYRPLQRETAAEVYRHIRDKKPILIEAPTGSGKTLTALFPAIKAFGENWHTQTLYLTSKGSTQVQAESTVRQLDPEGYLDTLIIQARDKVCPCLSNDENTRSSCTDDDGYCTRTMGFYDRLPTARSEALRIAKLTKLALAEIAETYHICPFALSLHLAPWLSIVVADVNYFFDPLVRLSCFDEHTHSRVILLDEAHNLPGRARDMYSAELDSALSEGARKSLPRNAAKLKKAIAKLVHLLRLLDEKPINEKDLTRLMYFPLQNLLQALQQEEAGVEITGSTAGFSSNYREWLKQLYRFAVMLQLFSAAHICSVIKDGKERGLKIRCLDASEFLEKLQAQARSTIAFSATLDPFNFTRQQLGLPQKTQGYRLPPVFPEENQCVICTTYITTHWRNREESLTPLVELIREVTRAKPGNYLVFFPSYAYLEMAAKAYNAAFPETELFLQTAASSDTQRQKFIDRFLKDDEPKLGFAIVGGLFAEGIDYAGTALLGAIIIGTGMPQPDDEQQQMSQYFSRCGLNGFQYAFQFPGLIRLRQTAGRVIRTESDKGVIVFVEPRLLRADNWNYLATHLTMQISESPAQLSQQIRDFWQLPEQ